MATVRANLTSEQARALFDAALAADAARVDESKDLIGALRILNRAMASAAARAAVEGAAAREEPKF